VLCNDNIKQTLVTAAESVQQKKKKNNNVYRTVYRRRAKMWTKIKYNKHEWTRETFPGKSTERLLSVPGRRYDNNRVYIHAAGGDSDDNNNNNDDYDGDGDNNNTI